MQAPQQASRYVFPALGALYERCQRFAYPILRVTFGVWFIPHGCQKLFGWWGGNCSRTAEGMAAAGILARTFLAGFIRNLPVVGGVPFALRLVVPPLGGAFFRLHVRSPVSCHLEV